MKISPPKQSRSIVVYAKHKPKNDKAKEGPHHSYKYPQIKIESKALKPLNTGFIRIQMSRVGICGTDLHLLETTDEGYTRCSSPFEVSSDGRILGHEGVGIITTLGKGVERFEVGDVVCFESIITCKSCEKCRQGNFNQCENSCLLGMEQDGLFTEYADVPASIAHRVNDMANSDHHLEGLACIEPAAVAYLACINARISPGEKVAVLGAGPIGYYSALMAKTLFGASHVCLSEPLKFRRDFAKSTCDLALDPESFSEGNHTFDVLIDAAGSLSDTSATISRMKGNGRLVLLSRTGQALKVDLVDQIISKSLHIIGSRGHLGGAMNAVLSLARSGRIDLHAPVTKVVEGLDGLAEVLNNPSSLMANDCKVIAKLS